jgi:hypothetical protein
MDAQQRAVVQQALEALTIQSDRVTEIGKQREAITALRQLLEAQPEPVQEPVAWMHVDAYQPSNRHLEWKENCKGYLGDWIKHPLYTTPPAQPADHIRDATEIVRPQNCGTGYCSCIECHFKKGGA